MFRYRLETLLKYRKTLEDDGKRTLAEANRRYLEESSRIDGLNAKKAEMMAMVGEMMANSPDAGMLMIYDGYLNGYDTDIKDETAKADQARKLMEIERQKLVETMKKRRIIEHHKEMLKARYNAEESRKERIQADEMTSARFSFKGER
jgi:flagellar FliJ protein